MQTNISGSNAGPNSSVVQQSQAVMAKAPAALLTSYYSGNPGRDYPFDKQRLEQ